MTRVHEQRGNSKSNGWGLLFLLLIGCGAAGGAPESRGNPPLGKTPVALQQAHQIRFERLPVAQLPRFVHFNGHPRASLLPEDNGSGCAWGDYDGDGDDDLFLCNFNGPYLMAAKERRRFPGSRLWRNDGNRGFTDVTKEAGVDDSAMDMSALFADFDNDGDQDLLVSGLDGLRLYRNRSGRFENVTRAVGLDGVDGYCLGTAWGDYDRDGRLDLYVCRYVDFPIDKARKRPLVAGRPSPMTTPNDFRPLGNFLFHQGPDGKFRDVSRASGTLNAEGRSMQAAWCDFDNDGWIDLYVANDQSLDCLFRNKHDGTFEDVALTYGVFDPRGAMGVAVTDFQDDGDQDLLITHWVGEDPAFYVNESEGLRVFEDRATTVGLRKEDGALVGWGIGFVDFDNDGDRDLYIVYGSTIEDELTLEVLKNPKMLTQRTQVYENRGGRWYALGATAGAYFDETHVGRGGAVSDFDRNGRPDIAINNHGGTPVLLRNVTKSSGHWVAFELVGRHCTRDAANARVVVHCQGARPQMQELILGGSYLSGNTKTLHFGVGTAERISRVEVRWPCGKTTSLEHVPVDQTIVITEERGASTP